MSQHRASDPWSPATPFEPARARVFLAPAADGGRVQSLPGYPLAAEQVEGQGLRVPLAAAVETVVAAPEGDLALVMVAKSRVSGTSRGGGGARMQVAIRHRGGNQQVVLANGQRWHLPPGKTPRDIPASDPLGDQLQEAATRVAREWGPQFLTDNEQAAIVRMLKQGKKHRARQLEAQARGRWVEAHVKELFRHLEWRHKGVDVVGPNGYNYELLSGTESNMKLHGRRMAGVFFRVITF